MTHDKFCMDHGLIDLATADCTCNGIAAIRSDERHEAAQRLLDLPAGVWGENLSPVDFDAIFKAVLKEKA